MIRKPAIIGTVLLVHSIASCVPTKGKSEPPFTSIPPTSESIEGIRAHWKADSYCAFDGRVLTYQRDGKSYRSILDAPIAEAESVLCSDRFTAIIATDHIVVALGGERLASGEAYLGKVRGGGHLLVNSYSIDIKRFRAEGPGGIAGFRIKDDTLSISTKKLDWQTDLSDPNSEWKGYAR